MENWLGKEVRKNNKEKSLIYRIIRTYDQ